MSICESTISEKVCWGSGSGSSFFFLLIDPWIIISDPNAQYYGEYEFDVEIPSVVFPFEASLTIGTSKRGNITSRIIWSFQGQSCCKTYFVVKKGTRVLALFLISVHNEKEVLLPYDIHLSLIESDSTKINADLQKVKEVDVYEAKNT